MGGHSSSAAKDAPVGDCAATDTGAHCYINEIVHALAGAELPLPDRCGDTVISD